MILITQFTGAIVGTIAPVSRCFASLSCKVSIKWIWNHIKVFKVENYYTQKLSDWKQKRLSKIPFKCISLRCKILIQDLMVMILSVCIGFQKMVVVTCKMLALIPVLFVIVVLCCKNCWKWLKVMLGVLDDVLVEKPSQLQHKDFSQYVLQLKDDTKLADRTLKSISKSITSLIQTAKNQQPNNLMKLLQESSGFEGVGKYDMHQVSPLADNEYVDCWSLPIVTLTTIAISLPNIQKNMVDRLLRSVSEGLTYVRLVEETLNATDISIQTFKRLLERCG